MCSLLPERLLLGPPTQHSEQSPSPGGYNVTTGSAFSLHSSLSPLLGCSSHFRHVPSIHSIPVLVFRGAVSPCAHGKPGRSVHVQGPLPFVSQTPPIPADGGHAFFSSPFGQVGSCISMVRVSCRRLHSLSESPKLRHEFFNWHA